MAGMRIRLKTQQREHPPGSVHDVLEIVPHGGYTDSERQYVIAGRIYVASDFAEVIETDHG